MLPFFLQFAGVLAAVLLQGSVLPVIVPWLPFNPALILLVFASFKAPRNRLLALALWAGLLQDVMYGEVLGLSMLGLYLGFMAVHEIKTEFVDHPFTACALRLIIAVLIQELTYAFFFYIRGATGLFAALQVNAGKSLLANLLLLGLAFLWLRFRNKKYLKGLMEEIS